MLNSRPCNFPSPLLYLACLCLLPFGPSDCYATEPLYDSDNGPFSALFGLPRSTESGHIQPAGPVRYEFRWQVASHSLKGATGTESIELDGETNRLSLVAKRRISEWWEVGIELPYVFHDSGGLDTFINTWHESFGLPDGIRDSVPRDRLLFHYRDLDGESLQINSSTRAAGDLRLIAGRQLWRGANSAGALRIGLKLPTGDSASLSSSGNTDISLGLAIDHDRLGKFSALSAFYNVQAIYLGGADLLSSRAKRWAGQFSGGFGWQPRPGFLLGSQVRLRSALFDSELRQLGSASAVLTVGGRIAISPGLELEFSVGEDIRVETAPDVTLNLIIRSASR